MNPNVFEVWETAISCVGGCGHRMNAQIERDKNKKIISVRMSGSVESTAGKVDFVTVQQGPEGRWSRPFCSTCGRTVHIVWRRKISG